MKGKDKQNEEKRGRFQFSLKTLCGIVLVSGIVMGLARKDVEHQNRMIQEDVRIYYNQKAREELDKITIDGKKDYHKKWAKEYFKDAGFDELTAEEKVDSYINLN